MSVPEEETQELGVEELGVPIVAEVALDLLLLLYVIYCLSAQAKGPFVTLEQNGLLLSL